MQEPSLFANARISIMSGTPSMCAQTSSLLKAQRLAGTVRCAARSASYPKSLICFLNTRLTRICWRQAESQTDVVWRES